MEELTCKTNRVQADDHVRDSALHALGLWQQQRLRNLAAGPGSSDHRSSTPSLLPLSC